jgi:hypothetical protein
MKLRRWAIVRDMILAMVCFLPTCCFSFLDWRNDRAGSGKGKRS